MMVNPVYCIRDRKGSFWRPEVHQNELSARRAFAMLVNNPDPMNTVHFAPHDYELFYIGKFDSETGDFTSAEKKEFIVSGELLVGNGYEK